MTIMDKGQSKEIFFKCIDEIRKNLHINDIDLQSVEKVVLDALEPIYREILSELREIEQKREIETLPELPSDAEKKKE